MSTETICYGIEHSRLGMVLVAATTKGICAILLDDDRTRLENELRAAFPDRRLVAGDADFGVVMDRVVRFLEAPKCGLDLPLDLHGTAFQQQVWQALREIPAGTTATYTEIANRVGAPAFAVGEACAANTIAVAVPCHRVVRKNGTLAGYRWGFKRKRALLTLEAGA